MVTGVDCVGRRNRSQVSPEPSATPLGPTGVFQAGPRFRAWPITNQSRFPGPR